MEAGSDGIVCAYEGVVEYERPDTWPPELLALFEREFECLEAYELRRAEIDKNRYIPQPNTFEQQREQIVQQADAILSTHRLLGFHCTRLTAYEMDDIKAEGLRRLAGALIRSRIKRAVAEGLIAQKQSTELLETHQADDDGRKGMTHFVNCRSFLAHEGDVGRLFRSWGGEALYNSHEGSKLGAVLRSIGNPAIVATAIPTQKFKGWFDNFGERFLRKFLFDRAVPLDQTADLQTHLRERVFGTMILEIITFADSRFESFTCCSTWQSPLE